MALPMVQWPRADLQARGCTILSRGMQEAGGEGTSEQEPMMGADLKRWREGAGLEPD
jgi:hypothetical protein